MRAWWLLSHQPSWVMSLSARISLSGVCGGKSREGREPRSQKSVKTHVVSDRRPEVAPSRPRAKRSGVHTFLLLGIFSGPNNKKTVVREA